MECQYNVSYSQMQYPTAMRTFPQGRGEDCGASSAAHCGLMLISNYHDRGTCRKTASR